MNLDSWIKYRFGVKPNSKTGKSSNVICKSTKDIIKEELSLKKAVHDKDWSTILTDHSTEHEKLIDPTYHSVNSNVHQDYHKLVHGTDTVHDTIPDAAEGISAKIIHKVGDNHFMTKPYFSKENRKVPLSGWSIMTTHNLYKAGGLKDLVEDVGVTPVNKTQHKNPVHVTVHKFAKDYKNAAELPRGGPKKNIKTPTVDLDAATIANPDLKEHEAVSVLDNYKNINNANMLHARQIGMMDFLTGNYDRHGNNLLVSNQESYKGRNLLAIDHDRSFNYLSISSPHEEYEKSAMARILGDHAGHKSDDHDHALSNWWKENKAEIYNEMNRNLNSISDHHLRKYVRRNFDQRYQMISDWADSYKDHKKSFFEKNIDSVISSHPLHHVDDESVQRVKDSLPENKLQALDIIFDQIKKPKEELDPKQIYAVQKIASDYLMDMPDKDVASFFSRDDSDQRIKTLKNDILMDMKREPEKHKSKMQHLIRVNQDLPEGSKFLNPFWEKHLAEVLSDNQIKAGAA